MSGYYFNTSTQLFYPYLEKPYDDVIVKDPFNDWVGFKPPSMAGIKTQPLSSVRYGTDYIKDNPLGQMTPGQLEGFRFVGPEVSVPRPIPVQQDDEIDSINLSGEQQANNPPTEKQTGNGQRGRGDGPSDNYQVSVHQFTDLGLTLVPSFAPANVLAVPQERTTGYQPHPPVQLFF